ncbi:CDGSH iron-sulfur domain-containing protein [Bacillus sp. B-jedd]|uniref:CDGSH iron-sulfur domain-containing protein n=1 Tax=Bacillus sp. B-jedd TaxID=1476857 RepID=UPI00051566B4|nr:CDGSH iron-sulfur domain-containing protein [Bacillus sp. B-jedd]CEG27181.1 Iron sulfur domain-containing protein [Bacillus sp. B-jedd]
MSKTELKVSDNGPIVIKGEFELLDGEGNPYKTGEQIKLCRCGLSNHKPFCDGSHRGKFESEVRAT